MSKKFFFSYALWPFLIIPFSPAVGAGLLAIWWCIQPIIFLIIIGLCLSGTDTNALHWHTVSEGMAMRERAARNFSTSYAPYVAPVSDTRFEDEQARKQRMYTKQGPLVP